MEGQASGVKDNYSGFEDNLVWDFKPIINSVHTERSCEWQKMPSIATFVARLHLVVVCWGGG